MIEIFMLYTKKQKPAYLNGCWLFAVETKMSNSLLYLGNIAIGRDFSVTVLYNLIGKITVKTDAALAKGLSAIVGTSEAFSFLFLRQ